MATEGKGCLRYTLILKRKGIFFENVEYAANTEPDLILRETETCNRNETSINLLKAIKRRSSWWKKEVELKTLRLELSEYSNKVFANIRVKPADLICCYCLQF